MQVYEIEIKPWKQDASKDRKSNREAHLNNIIKLYINNIGLKSSRGYLDSYWLASWNQKTKLQMRRLFKEKKYQFKLKLFKKNVK